jgi:hypothetical protein
MINERIKKHYIKLYKNCENYKKLREGSGPPAVALTCFLPASPLPPPYTFFKEQVSKNFITTA